MRPWILWIFWNAIIVFISATLTGVTTSPTARQKVSSAVPVGDGQLSIVFPASSASSSDCVTPLDPAAAAQHAGISPSHLRRLLKKETGKNLSQHLKTLRVEAAKQLLLESPLNTNELAWRVGYSSAPHFCTLFKKETGQTTTEYAQSLGKPKYK